MTLHIPVLVGLSQILQRTDDPGDAKTPIELMHDAVRAAAEDSGAPGLLAKTTSIRVTKGIWGYKNPALEIAQMLGLGGVETGVSALGGNHVQMMLNQCALEIQSGARDVIVLTGAECGRTMGRAQKAGLEIPWLEEDPQDPTAAPDIVYGTNKWTRHDAEMARGIQRAVQYYSLFEIALRHHRGESPGQHLDRIAELWASFSRVAQDNPNAWIRKEITADTIRTPTPSNRSITFPYTKFMNANMRVDMGAALILCSLDTARALGIDESKFVYPWVGTDAYDHYFVSERDNLYSSPAIRIAGGRALELAEVSPEDLDHVDLYSCFPSAVQVAAQELGLSQEGPLSVTGGLTFGGGPLNNYVMHSIARTAELLRETGGRALVTANGGMLTKHSFGVYGKERPGRDFRHANLQDEVDAQPRTEVAVEATGPATIESYVVVYGGSAPATKSATAIYGAKTESADTPSLAHLACKLPDGRRTWANTYDPEVLDAMCSEEFCGRRVVIDGEGGAQIT